jgi:hypothetical protein
MARSVSQPAGLPGAETVAGPSVSGFCRAIPVLFSCRSGRDCGFKSCDQRSVSVSDFRQMAIPIRLAFDISWRTQAATFFAGLFAFFAICALQGLLMNILPTHLFDRVSVLIQALLATSIGGSGAVCTRHPGLARAHCGAPVVGDVISSSLVSGAV